MAVAGGCGLAVVWGPVVAVVIGLDVIGSCGLVGRSGLEVCGSQSVAAMVVVAVVVVKVDGGCDFDEVDASGCVAVELCAG